MNLPCVVAACAWLSLSAAAQEAPRRTSHERALPLEGVRELLDAHGRAVGSWSLGLEGVELRAGGRALALPRLQAWLASPDGRTLVGSGDELAPEHPLELTVRVWREGEFESEFDERFDPESELTVGADGRVALVGQRAGERGRPIARVLAPDGELLRHDLRAGMTAHDPVLVADGLLVRMAPLAGSSSAGEILRVDELGVRTLLDAPGALALIALPGHDEVLVHERDALSRVDARSGRVLWRRVAALRPANEHAWALWSTREAECVALVTAGVLRRGERAPAPVRLELFELASGAPRASVALEPGGPPGRITLRSVGAALVVGGKDLEEVFAW